MFKKCIHIASIDEVDEIKNLAANLNTIDTTMEIIPETTDSLENECLIVWSHDDRGFLRKSESLSQAEAFLSGMNLCMDHDYLRKRVVVEKNSYTRKTGILFPLIALEQKIPYILEPEIALTSLVDDNVPFHNIKPYSFKRPKITVTFEELENNERMRMILRVIMNSKKVSKENSQRDNVMLNKSLTHQCPWYRLKAQMKSLLKNLLMIP